MRVLFLIMDSMDSGTIVNFWPSVDSFVANRYASYNEGIGKKIADKTATIEELEAYALAMGDVKNNISGRQEYLENIMNAVMFQ